MMVRVERGYILYAKLGGTAEVESFCPSRDIRTGAFFVHARIRRAGERKSHNEKSGKNDSRDNK